MEREFLLGLAGMSEEMADAILEENGKDIQLWQEKYRQAVYDGRLSRAIATAGGRNHKAIAALLDAESLKDADDAAVLQAVEQVKAECGYLFCAPVPYAPGTGAVQPEVEKSSSLADALRERFGG